MINVSFPCVYFLYMVNLHYFIGFWNTKNSNLNFRKHKAVYCVLIVKDGVFYVRKL